MVLDISAQSEQQCKDSIHLARTNIEHCIPQALVEIRWFGEGIEIQVFEEVNDNDAHNGKSAKAINNVNALWLDALFHYLLIFIVHPYPPPNGSSWANAPSAS